MQKINHLHSLIVFIVLLLVSGSLVAWLYVRPEISTPQTDHTVAATIFPLYDIAKNITGDSIEVILILPAGSDAHSFEPSPSLILNLQNAEVVYQIGHEFDDWVIPLTENVGAENFIVDQGINLKASHEEEHDEEGEHEHEEEHEHHHGPTDPHYWLTCENAQQIAANIAEDLSVRFPELTDTFADNLVSYSSQLETLDQEIRSNLKNLPNKNIVTFHDAWYYFSDEYGLNIAGTFEPTAGREPTAQYLTHLVEEIQELGVTTMYYEPQMSISNMKNFVADYSIQLEQLDPIGGQAPYDSYINLMKTNVSSLQKNK